VSSDLNWTIFGLSLALAHVLAWGLNLLIHHLGQEGEDYTWLMVVVGVGGTLVISLALIPWQYVLVILAYFAASGVPMILGALYRTVRARREARLAAISEGRQLRREALNEQTKTTAVRGERAAE
jgi:hypothetical protein